MRKKAVPLFEMAKPSVCYSNLSHSLGLPRSQHGVPAQCIGLASLLWKCLGDGALQTVAKGMRVSVHTRKHHVRKEGAAMQPTVTDHEKQKAILQQEIDRKLSKMPRAQQNLVAAFAQGLKHGLAIKQDAPKKLQR